MLQHKPRFELKTRFRVERAPARPVGEVVRFAAKDEAGASRYATQIFAPEDLNQVQAGVWDGGRVLQKPKMHLLK